jgi:subfamily B ATP-binding cassette protein MsbA
LAKANDTSTQKGSISFDSRTRGLIERSLRDWVYPLRGDLLISFALMLALAIVTGCYPRLIKYSFDELPRGDMSLMFTIAGLIILATSARAFLMFLTSVTTNRFVMKLGNNMQKAAIQHLLNADFARLTRDSPGQLISRITNDVGQVQGALSQTVTTTARDAMTVIALVGYMVWSDPILSVIVLGVYPIAIWPIITIGKRLKAVSRRTQEELASMLSLLSEQFGSPRLIKTYRLEDYASGRMIGSIEQIYKLRLKAVRSKARLDPMLEVLGGVAIAGVIALATWRIASGISTVGDFMAFVTALVLAAQPTRSLGNISVRIQEGLAGAERFYEMLDEQPAVVDKPGAKALVPGNGSLRFDSVSFGYERVDGQMAVRDFTLDVPGGKTVALVGRSGAGKSTIINLVPRLFDVGSGSISINYQDVRDVTLQSLRDSIAVVSQDVTLFDDSIRNNIALGRLSATDAEIVAAAKAAAAHEFILEQDHGYDTIIGDRGMRLSGGQRQRIALARAILRNAAILLLDEATSALDNESERLVQDALARFTKGRTTLVIAHRLSTVQSADLICVMEAGRIIETGTHVELLARGGGYARLARTELVAPTNQSAAE